MSSRRRSRSRERRGLESSSRATAAANKLRMDSKPQTPRITDPSLPAGRRREIDNVMKKARAASQGNGYWDKKLLEVEAKDPNRWRHSGYKSLYLEGSSSPSPGRRRSRSRSPAMRRRSSPSHRSPPPDRRRSPPPRRSPPGMKASGGRPGRPRSPPSHKSPQARRRSPSASSVSSCSDDSCSVCSPKNNHRRVRSRSRSFSVPRSRPKPRAKAAPPPPKARLRPRPPSPSPSPPPPRRASKGKPTDPRRQPDPRRNLGGDVAASSPSSRNPGPPPPHPSSLRGPRPQDKPQPVMRKDKRPPKDKVLLTRIKKEQPPGAPKRVRKSPGPAESSGSEDSSSSSTSAVVAATRLTLSERFGKMAQWSVDRERRDIENMRITKNSAGGDLKVMIEEDAFLYRSPPPSHSPAPVGHYPEELLATGPSGLAAWDDVRVRYQYYKDLGYLRDLTLDDYVKWEEWWYKYQDWLKAERYYEHWVSTQSRRRRKRLPATQRLN